MSNTSSDRIDDVAAGDIIAVDRGDGARPFRVVHIDATDTGFVVTLEDDGGETFDRDFAAGETVTRTLESKWESQQTPVQTTSDPEHNA